MSMLSVRLFGSLDHSYPIVEVYNDDELIFEVITSDDGGSVEVVSSGAVQQLESSAIERLMALVLPQWRAALQARDAARAR